MIKRFWAWFWGPSTRDERFFSLVEKIIDSQQEIVESQRQQTTIFASAMESVGEASKRNAEVLQSYLKLFATPEEPRSWKFDEVNEEENLSDLMSQDGFPKDGSDADMAQWVLDNMSKMER